MNKKLALIMSAPLVALSPVAAVVSCSDTSAPVIKNVRLEKSIQYESVRSQDAR